MMLLIALFKNAAKQYRIDACIRQTTWLVLYEANGSRAISNTTHFVSLVWLPLIKIIALTSCGIHLGGGEYVLQSDLATPLPSF